MEVFKGTLHSEPSAAWVFGVAHRSQIIFLGQLYAGLKAAAPAQLLQTSSKGDKQALGRGIGNGQLCVLCTMQRAISAVAFRYCSNTENQQN